jgi:hypothetical protein
MLKPISIILLTATVILGGCSPLSKNANSVASAEPVDPDAVRCRTVVRTGTRIGSKVCRTNRTWDAMAVKARDDLEATQRTSTQGNTYQTGGNSN